jgi:hypothetical protein
MRTRVTHAAVILVLAVAVSPAFAQMTAASGDAGGTPRVAATPPSFAAASAPAQIVRAPEAPPLMPHGYLSVNAGYQGTTNSFTNSWSLPYYLETESLNASYSIRPGMLIDVGAGARLVRNLAVGVAFSRYHRSEPASLSASVPNPLLYDHPRSVEAPAPGPARTETAIHLSAMWVFAAAARIQVGVFGGPSLFNVNQLAITSVNFAEVYPYDTVTIGDTATRSQRSWKAGFNVGGDLTFLLRRQVGVGALVRYSAVHVGFNAPDGAQVSLKAGGLQVGGGLRLRF